MNTLSLIARISLVFALAASLVLLTTGFFLTRAVESHFEEEDRHELRGKLELIQNLFRHVRHPQELDRLSGQLANALVGHPGLAVEVRDAAGGVWFATENARFPAALRQDCSLLPAACQPGTQQQWQNGDNGYRGMAMPISTGGGVSYNVVVAQDIRHHQRFLDKFRSVLAIAIALAALATACLGWMVTRWGLAPLRQVTRMVAGMSADRLSDRLLTTGLPAEIRPLVTAFNAMLARLDDSFRRLSEFSSNIAHELRTPITSLMTQTQVALSSARSTDEYKEILYSSLEEYERMAQMVGDMLYLAQADNRLLKPAVEKNRSRQRNAGFVRLF